MALSCQSALHCNAMQYYAPASAGLFPIILSAPQGLRAAMPMAELPICVAVAIILCSVVTLGGLQSKPVQLSHSNKMKRIEKERDDD